MVEDYARQAKHQQEKADGKAEPFVLLYCFLYVHKRDEIGDAKLCKTAQLYNPQK